jgi:RNA recognition motif-containing protein
MKIASVLVVVTLSLLVSASAQASKKLFVGGLSWNTSSAELERYVAPFGPVLSISVHSVDHDGRQGARAVVEYETGRDARAAARALDGSEIGGQPVSAKVREIVVVGSKVKEVIREAGLRSDGDLVQAVSDKVHELLRDAIGRAKSNKRGTVRPHDL